MNPDRATFLALLGAAAARSATMTTTTEPARVALGSQVAYTPLDLVRGLDTPNALFFVRNHAGIPVIRRDAHALLIHGLVDRPVALTLDDLAAFPQVRRRVFLECAGNSSARYGARVLPFAFNYGLASCAEWSGVRVGDVLAHAKLRSEACWILAEGADACHFERSIPLDALADALLVTTQNGEPLRAEQGFPLRLLIPGAEGSANVKWLRRLKALASPVYSREETATYTGLLPDGTARAFDLRLGVKSLLVSPAPGMDLKANPVSELRGIAWSGGGRITRVDVSDDGGHSWRRARMTSPAEPCAFTSFAMPWRWSGAAVSLQSRAFDETGARQPTRAELLRTRGAAYGYHMNAISTWSVDSRGHVDETYA